MFTIQRGIALGLACATLLASAPLWSEPASAGKQPPNVDRPLLYLTPTKVNGSYRTSIALSDVADTSQIVLKQGGSLNYFGRLRWSPDGQLIGGYLNYLGFDAALGKNWGIMVMTPEGANEAPLVTSHEFRIWNLSRPGVLGFYDPGVHELRPCWLGNAAFVFEATTRYDASLFGGNEGSTVTARRLFIADAAGDIVPLTETADFGGTTFASVNPSFSSHSDPHWSAAQDKVVFVGGAWPDDNSPPNELYAINPDGSGLVQITDFGGTVNLCSPIWSPAGERILVAAKDLTTGGAGLLILDVDLSLPNPGTGTGGRVTYVDPFKSDYGTGRDFGWSPDGQEVIFARYAPGDKKNPGFIGLVAADVETGAERVLLRSVDCHYPDWRPVP